MDFYTDFNLGWINSGFTQVNVQVLFPVVGGMYLNNKQWLMVEGGSIERHPISYLENYFPENLSH